MSELIVLSVEQYELLKDKGYIVRGVPKFIESGKTQRALGHDAAYSLVRFFFTPALDKAVEIGGVRIEPDHIRQKLEPKLWRELLRK